MSTFRKSKKVNSRNLKRSNVHIDSGQSPVVQSSCLSLKKLMKPKKKKKNYNSSDINDDQEVSNHDGYEDQEMLDTPENMNKMANTLREWILSSPGIVPESINGGGEVFMFTQLCQSVYECSAEFYDNASPCKARDSLSLERPPKLAAGDHHDEGEERCKNATVSRLCRSQSTGSNKKVSFRLPEKADTIIFYSPKLR